MWPIRDDFPGRQHHDDGNERRQGHKPHRNTIHPEVVVHVEALNPQQIFLELQGCGGGVKARNQRQGDEKASNRTSQRNPPGYPGVFAAANRQQYGAECNRQPDGNAQKTHSCSPPSINGQ